MGNSAPGRRRRRTTSALRATLLLSLAGCERDAEPHVKPDNVIVLLADTLRADHMSLYGYARDTTPALRKLAADGVVFEHARSQAPCTFPSVNSLLTSRTPLAFYGRGYGDFGIPDDVPSLATMLQRHGFATLAVSASALVRATPSKHNKVGGFQQGFDAFDEQWLSRAASCVNERALRLIDDAAKPFFLYVHYMDPHAPYQPPPEHRRRFAREWSGAPQIGAGDLRVVERTIFKHKRPDLVPAEDVFHLRDLYDDEIAYLDAQIDGLFAALERRELLERTMVVLAADHGEEFLEHASLGHCRTLYDTETRTPLVLWIPGVPGGRIAAAVENLDVVPTVLDYLALPIAADLEGTSLRPLIAGRAQEATRLTRGFTRSLRSLGGTRHKVILDTTTGAATAFDLAVDPGEASDLLGQGSATRELLALRDQLVAQLARTEGENVARNARHGQEIEAALRSLGYLE